MQVELQSSEGLLRRLAIEIPANEIDVEVDRRIKDMSRRVRLDGFRPGKAPLPVVRQRYFGQVRDEVVGDVMGRAYQAAIAEQNLRPAGCATAMSSRPAAHSRTPSLPVPRTASAHPTPR
ncbi:MAG: hypothetical protein B7Z82_02375 [Halothiobacillus sp. 20-54-6]|nr:MAG: hypothetical protein B7Z82_02375 [Halothiobacillus sp. 20-54-6]